MAASTTNQPRRLALQNSQASAYAADRMDLLRATFRSRRTAAGQENLVQREWCLFDNLAPIFAAADCKWLLCPAHTAVHSQPEPSQVSAPARAGGADCGRSNRSVNRAWTCFSRSSESQNRMRPDLIMATWSETRSTSASRCDENSTVRPSSAIVRMMAPRMSRRTIGSRPDDGSSSSSSSGR